MNLRVCILTAGIGTRMGPYANYINKALLPLNKKAIISHIIEKFTPQTEFIVATGFLAKQVETYLEIAHPKLNVTFVRVDNYDKKGSGPGHSLLCCKEHLLRPFYFVSSDTLWANSLNFDSGFNWLGTARVSTQDSVNYCNVRVIDGKITDLKDKEQVPESEYRAFVGLCYIHDYKIFWESLADKNVIAGEHQISNGLQALIKSNNTYALDIDWTDVGNNEKYRNVISRYENYDFSKINETLYITDRKVIKFFSDQRISEDRVKKAALNPKVFPSIVFKKGQFYAYNFIPGETLYRRNNLNTFKELLDWLDENLWIDVEGVDQDEFNSACRKFYHDKTFNRLKQYYDKYDDIDRANFINEVPVPPLNELLKQISWDMMYHGVPKFIHGDLQFDNIIHDQSTGGFSLLDWRQDFGGKIEYGDIYYDLAKIYGGILLNYDHIKDNLMYFDEVNGKIHFDFAQRYLSGSYLTVLEDYVNSKNYNLVKVRILVALIYLNMSALHHFPFDKMLFYLGKSLLHKFLNPKLSDFV